MTSDGYIAYLRRLFAPSAEEQENLREQRLRWGRIRSEQFDDPELGEMFARLGGADVSEMQTRFIHDYILGPLTPALPSSLQGRLGSITIAALPTRAVNACVTKAPEGELVVIFDGGLFSMLDFYLETKPALIALARTEGMEAATAYIGEAYRFVVEHYEHLGAMSFPLPAVKVPAAHKAFTLQQALAIETFVLAHELGHVHKDHLGRAVSQDLRGSGNDESTLTLYQQSWEQEYEADALGWTWYQQAWPSMPEVRGLPPEVAKTAPLLLLEYLALIEANVRHFRERLGSHPPATDRVSHLLEQISAEGDEETLERALELSETIFNMPVLARAHPVDHARL